MIVQLARQQDQWARNTSTETQTLGSALNLALNILFLCQLKPLSLVAKHSIIVERNKVMIKLHRFKYPLIIIQDLQAALILQYKLMIGRQIRKSYYKYVCS
ncbi:UNKNOWN [Stylonychia lemnae]|uniref:Uncharacterized protein n=1 Tax=Stylonychia lemnae TaxID=5949 RepID=A0A078A2V0_STYLE|nr:UNKNOWN [Stylonychia lemnae]|eukprot:CDW76608.1 UNKNOWN [Stylonychia lemnae]